MPAERPKENIEYDEDGRIAFKDRYENGRLVSRTSYLHAADGSFLHAFESTPDEKGKLVISRAFYLYPDGSPLRIHDLRTKTVEYFGKSGKKIMHETNPMDKKLRDIVMFDEKGEILIHTYQAEKRLRPSLAPQQYIDDILVKNLNTPERLHFFFDHFIEYLADTEDRFRGNPDYWQKPEETVEMMTGDCEDAAILAQYILRKQGKNPYVLQIPTDVEPKRPDEAVHVHATCIWIEERSDGRYDVKSLCDFGLDINGNPFVRREKPERSQGYSKKDIVKGLNALAEKYPASLIGLPAGKTYAFDPTRIRILHAPDRRRPGQATATIVTTDVFFKK